MRSVLSAIMTALALTFAGLVLATPAQADTRHCVSRHEYKVVKKGWHKSRVHRLFDISGTFADGGAGGYSRLYRECRDLPPIDGCWVIIEYASNPKTQVARVAQKRWNGWCTAG